MEFKNMHRNRKLNLRFGTVVFKFSMFVVILGLGLIININYNLDIVLKL